VSGCIFLLFDSPVGRITPGAVNVKGSKKECNFLLLLLLYFPLGRVVLCKKLFNGMYYAMDRNM
jgi:hypothetical protein